MSDQDFRRWKLSSHDLENVTPLKGRDLITKCLLEAQKETFARAKERLGKSTEEAEIEKSVIGTIRMTFKEAKSDYDHPTKEDLQKAVELLAHHSASWGTPVDIIEFHQGQIMQVLEKLA